MKSFFIKWVVNILALLAVVHIVPGIKADNWETAVLAALVLGLINATLRPLLLVFTLPFNLISLGALTLFINGFMFYLVSRIVEGFSVANFWSAFWGALFFSIVSSILNLFFSAPVRINVRARGNNYPRKKVYDNAIDVEGRVEEDQ